MHLYHSTDDRGRDGIEAHGFAHSGRDDRLSNDHGVTYLVGGRDPCVTANRRVWWVIVNVPDEADVAQYLDPIYADPASADVPEDQRIYVVPWSVLNAWAPFTFERWAT